MRKPRIDEDTWILLLLAIAIFATDFTILAVMQSIIYLPSAFNFLNASVLVLVTSPLLLIPKRRIENSRRKLEKINSILKAIRKVNEVISKEFDAERMLSKACKILQEVKGYFYVAIATGKDIRKIAESGNGFEKECKAINARQAIETKKPVIFEKNIGGWMLVSGDMQQLYLPIQMNFF